MVGRAVLAGVLATAFAAAAETPWVIENEDNDHYYYFDKSKMTKEALEAYADDILEGGYVTHVFWCANGQRPSYDSKAWEPIWAALDDKETNWEYCDKSWPLHAKLLKDRGLDPFKIWIDRTRAKGASPWISMRMNDVHGGWHKRGGRCTRFYQDHPEWRVLPGFKGGMWEPYSMDYAIPEVREHHLKLVKELVERYDADGIELDFQRTGTYFKSDDAANNAPIMTDFIRTCRELATAAGKKRGRPMQVAIRMPTSPAAALAAGFEVTEIAKQGLVDVIIPCIGSPGVCWDLPWEEWTRTVGAVAPKVRLVAGTTAGYGDRGRWHSPASLRAWAATMRAKGAKDFYVFNLQWTREELRKAVHPGACLSEENAKRGHREFLVDGTLPPLTHTPKIYRADFVKAAFKPDGWTYSVSGGEARKFDFSKRTHLRQGQAADGKDWPVRAKGKLVGELVAERDGEAVLGMGFDWRWELDVNGNRIFGRNALVEAQDSCRYRASDWTIRVPVKKGSNRVEVGIDLGSHGLGEMRALDPAEVKGGIDLFDEEEYWHYVKLGKPKPRREPVFPRPVSAPQRWTRELPTDVKAAKSVAVLFGLSGKPGAPVTVYLNGVKATSFAETTPPTGREARYEFPLSALKGGENEISTDAVAASGATITWAAVSLD